MDIQIIQIKLHLI